MTWVKLSDTFAEDPRWDNLGAAGMALHIAALCYCNRLLTDGVLTRTRAERLFPVDDPAGTVNALIEAGFWQLNGADIEIVDYAIDQKTRAKVETERAESAARQAAFRNRRNGVTNGATNSVSNPYPGPARPGVLSEHKGRGGARSAERTARPHPPQQVAINMPSDDRKEKRR